MRYSIGGIILVTIGVLMLLDNLDVLDFGRVMGTYWPLIIIIWGFFILQKRSHRQNEQSAQPAQPATASSTTFGTAAAATEPPPASPFQAAQESNPNDLVHESNVFGDIFLNVTSQNFKGGSVSTVFGNSDIDLSKAVFADGEHILRVHGVFGNSRIIVSKDAPISVSASATFGKLMIFNQRKEGISTSSDIATPTYASSRGKLKIIASKVFGDVIIS